jgi:Antirepressor regulating drug resistance, predicted signal transduction N-terminal membrane component
MDMTALGLAFNPVANRASELAIAALWQGVLVAGALAICLRVAPRLNAAYRFSIWAVAFVALVGLSVFSLVPEFSIAAAHADAVQAAEQASQPLFNRPLFSFGARWSLAIAALWLAASLYRVADLLVHSWRLRKLWKDAEPVEIDERVNAMLAASVDDCGRGPVEVCTTKTLQRPSVIGFLRPRILIPDWLFARLTQGELEQIMLHEAEHLRRRDDWTNLAQKLCLVLFPLNPALAWIERRLCREREMACDDGVIRITRKPRAYAACLTSMAERGLERRVEALSLGAWQRRSELVHRVHGILRSKSGFSPAGARVLMGTVSCGLLAGSLVLARSPQLVAFVPEQPEVAARQVQKPAPAQKDHPAQHAAAFAASKQAQSHTAASPLPHQAVAPVAMNVTLREPEQNIAMNVPESALGSHTPAAVMASTERHAVQAAPTEQWVVLTAWEQVETYSDGAGIRADYTMAENDVNQRGAVLPQDADPVNRIAVTQLILRLMPVRAGVAVNATNSAQKHGIKSSTSQPGGGTFHDGWLVIQL